MGPRAWRAPGNASGESRYSHESERDGHKRGGVLAEMPKSMCPTRREAARAHGIPTASLAAVRASVSREIIHRIAVREAPTARRIPISCVRHDTE